MSVDVSDNSLVKFVAEFSADGIDDVKAKVADLRQATEAARDRTREMHKALGSGEWAQGIRQAEQYRRQMVAIQAEQKKLTYQARLGRLGGAIAYHADRLAASPLARGGARLATAAAVGGVATITGAARAGLSGTVEMNALTTQITLASREIAGAFVPALRIATKAAQGIRKSLERMSPKEQNALLGGTLLAGGALAGNALSKSLFGTGLGTLSAGLLFGAGGAAGAAGAAGTGAGLGTAAAGAATGGAAAARAGLGGRAGGAALRYGGPLAALYAVGQGASGGYYDDLRAKGNSRLVAGLGALGGGALDLLTFGEFTRRGRETGRFGNGLFNGKGKQAKDNVTIADAGFASPGDAYERVAAASSIAEAEAATGGKPAMEEVRDILKDLRDVIRTELGKILSPAAPPMPGR